MVGPTGISNSAAVPAPRRAGTSGLARLPTATATERREWRFACLLLLPAILALVFIYSFFVENYVSAMTGAVKG